MKTDRALTPVLIAFVAGAGLWSAAAMISGKKEAWDAATYWVLAYPAALLICACLGYAYQDRPWRWALVLFEAQFVAMCIRNGELGGLWPLGIVLFAIVSLPGMLAANLAARFGRKSESEVA